MNNRIVWVSVAAAVSGCANIEGVYPTPEVDDSSVDTDATESSDPDGGAGPSNAPEEPTDTGGLIRADGTTGCRDVQTGRITEGARAELTGVTVTTPMGIGAPGFFVQDLGGGPWSGLWVYLDEVIADVELGDVIDVSGTVAEWHGLTELIVNESVEISDTAVDRTVDASTLMTIPPDWEPYESVVITLEGVALSGAQDDRGNPMTNWYIGIADTFMDVSMIGGSYRQVTGVLTYNWGSYKLAPRSAADFQR